MDHSDTSSAAAAGIFGAFALFYFLFICVIVAFFIWMYWRIFAKAGFSGALALLNLIPGVGSLVCIIILAFGTWPRDAQTPYIAVNPSGTPPAPLA